MEGRISSSSMKPSLVLGVVGNNSLLYLSQCEKACDAEGGLNGFRGIKSGCSMIDNSKGNNFNGLLFAPNRWTNLPEYLVKIQGYLQCSSWKLQYELLESARLSILKKLVDRIHEAKMFSIIVEEATGISNTQKEQLCLTVRYYYDGEVCENFLIIRPLPSEKSDEITKHIMDAIKEVGIDFNKAKLIGQEYRGKNAASGNNGGIQKAIKDLHPMAFYIHPSAHSFNSAICNATTVQLVTVVMMQINKISQFLGESSQRWKMLKEAVEDLRISDGRKQSLYPCCEIPWNKDNMSFNAFYQLFPVIINVLSRLSLDNDETIETIVSARKAGNYLDTILKEQFIKVLLLLKESFKTLTDISGEFQKIDLRIIPAMERIQNLTLRVDEWLKGEGSCTIENIEADYQDLKELVLDYYIRKAPYNFNFEQKIFRPFLIDFRQQLRSYFGQHFHLMAQFVFLLPGKMAEFREVSDLVKFYIDNNLVSAGTDDVRHEYYQWHKYAIDKLYFPLTELIPKALKMNFKTIATLLQAYVTIPASDGERSCSSLKDIKECLQNSTFDSHFNALFSIYSNDNIQCTEEEVITMFKARRVHFA